MLKFKPLLFVRTLVCVMAASLAFTPCMVTAQVPELVPVPMQGGGITALPSIGGESSTISWAEERELGDQIASLIQQDLAYEKDPLLHDYVNHIWYSLLTAARNNGELSQDLYQRMAWEMFLVRDPSVNAFALPGAYIGVNLGLISVVETRDELASVLAHESVHIFQRHIARMYGTSKDLSAVSLASIILGILAMGIDPNLGGAIITGGTAAAVQGQIDFTRAMEYEADRIGYRVLVSAGFRPQGMAEMFTRLAEAYRFSDTTNFPYLSTHPMGDERIAEAQMRFGIDLHSQTPPVDLMQNVMSARALVLSRTQPDALRALVDRAFDSTKSAPRENISIKDLYAGAFAAVKLRQFDKADQLIELLLLQTQSDFTVHRVAGLLAVEAALESGALAKAQQHLALLDGQSTPELERAELFMRVQVALASGNAPTAVNLLQPWVFAHGDDELGWNLLTSAYRQNGQVVLSLRAEAEARMAIGDFDGAIDRFKVALNQGNSQNTTAYDLEVIQSRLKAAQQAQAKRQQAKQF